jgi:hypothetical protein
MRQMVLGSLLALVCTGCVAPLMRSTVSSAPTPRQSAELWEAPNDLATRNLYDGPWGMDLAPDPAAIYSFVSAKTVGVSPGFTVTDERGMEWSVKQGPEARVEVVMSRLLSAVGYHQPPVYYLPRWTIKGGPSSGVQPEARFRPRHTVLKDEGEWSWQENPFIGTQPYDGLRVLMMILNQSDLKNSNNTLYQVEERGDPPNAPQRWYVVRDIGAALGETGRYYPRRNNLAAFERIPFINSVKDNAVNFNYHGRHQELADHITPADVRWMCDLLARLSVEQWRDAFRAGGYGPETSSRFITRIRQKVAEGQALTTS